VYFYDKACPGFVTSFSELKWSPVEPISEGLGELKSIKPTTTIKGGATERQKEGKCKECGKIYHDQEDKECGRIL